MYNVEPFSLEGDKLEAYFIIALSSDTINYKWKSLLQACFPPSNSAPKASNELKCLNGWHKSTEDVDSTKGIAGRTAIESHARVYVNRSGERDVAHIVGDTERPQLLERALRRALGRASIADEAGPSAQPRRSRFLHILCRMRNTFSKR